MRQRKTKRAIERIAYSPSGRLLVGREGHNDVQVWDARALEPVEVIPAGDARQRLIDCLFWPGGSRFLLEQGYCSDAQDLPAGGPRPEHQNALPLLAPEKHGWAWSARWNTPPNQHIACFGPDGRTFVGWHPDVQGAAVGLWNFDGQLVRAFEWMADWTVNDMGVTADGRFLAAAQFSGSGYEVAVVDLAAGTPPGCTLYHTDNVLKVAWSPAAPLLACAATRSVWVWDAPAAISAHGQAGPHWSLQPAAPAHRFTGFRKTVEGLVFSPDGALLVAGAREGRVRAWEVASGRERADFDWKSGKVNDLAFSPDGSTIAAACSKGVVVWDVE